jgi:CheY-like chemotaxis protein
MLTILLIEDNEEIRDNTAELLEINHYHVVSAENGYRGYLLARNNQPDLVLCDMMMPESEGRAFLKLTRNDAALQQVPVIFFSADTYSGNDQNALSETGDGYLKKPFLEKDLLGTIQQVLTNRKARLAIAVS